jgi:hypothetical protein
MMKYGKTRLQVRNAARRKLLCPAPIFLVDMFKTSMFVYEMVGKWRRNGENDGVEEK